MPVEGLTASSNSSSYSDMIDEFSEKLIYEHSGHTHYPHHFHISVSNLQAERKGISQRNKGVTVLYSELKIQLELNRTRTTTKPNQPTKNKHTASD